jgi:hypothetical protein
MLKVPTGKKKRLSSAPCGPGEYVLVGRYQVGTLGERLNPRAKNETAACISPCTSSNTLLPRAMDEGKGLRLLVPGRAAECLRPPVGRNLKEQFKFITQWTNSTAAAAHMPSNTQPLAHTIRCTQHEQSRVWLVPVRQVDGSEGVVAPEPGPYKLKLYCLTQTSQVLLRLPLLHLRCRSSWELPRRTLPHQPRLPLHPSHQAPPVPKGPLTPTARTPALAHHWHLLLLLASLLHVQLSPRRV